MYKTLTDEKKKWLKKVEVTPKKRHVNVKNGVVSKFPYLILAPNINKVKMCNRPAWTI